MANQRKKTRFWKRPINTVITGLFSFLFVSSIIFVGLVYPKYGCLLKWHPYTGNDVFNHPSKIFLNGKEYNFDTELYRDFMPGPGSNTHFLVIAIMLIKNNNDSFPSGIKITHVWLRKNNTILMTECSDSSYIILGNRYSKHIGCGPEWEEGTLVDVAIRIVINKTVVHYLAISNRPVNYVY
ncbi:MAG: hypothetical protein P8Y97_08910 [Candidatus Lokiarchaeota archaeon]